MLWGECNKDCANKTWFSFSCGKIENSWQCSMYISLWTEPSCCCWREWETSCMGHEFNMEVIFLKIIYLVLVTVNCCCHFHTLVSVVYTMNVFLYYVGFFVFHWTVCIVKMWLHLACTCTLMIHNQIAEIFITKFVINKAYYMKSINWGCCQNPLVKYSNHINLYILA